MRGITDPAVSLLIILLIGIVVGVILDRAGGSGWLARRVAGPRGGMITSSLVGIAGSFIGYHVAGLLRLGGALMLYVGAVIGAVLVLWLWRMAR
jgi:uncharacterized membrane protein YeaQ/YmgE (transglycosylase-associated protein family)